MGSLKTCSLVPLNSCARTFRALEDDDVTIAAVGLRAVAVCCLDHLKHLNCVAHDPGTGNLVLFKPSYSGGYVRSSPCRASARIGTVMPLVSCLVSTVTSSFG